jgi:hypothetical protein
VGRVLFVADQNVADPVFVFVEFIVYEQNRASGIAENGIHALFNQGFD